MFHREMVTRCTLALILVAPGLLPGQAELAPEVLALARIEQKVQQRLARLPDYTCLQTIERSTRPSASRPFKRIDVVRLEVAHIGKQELYSWPGAAGFEEETAGRVVRGGTTSSGDFAQHLRSVFASRSASITYAGRESLNGRPALRYDFSVPLFSTQWMLNIAGKSGAAASAGSFWADPETYDLMQLEARADQIPPEVPVAAVVTRIEYGKKRIGPEEVWLPESAELLVTNLAGQQDRNRTEFSHCRQYLGTSAVSFGLEPAPDMDVAARPAPVQDVQLPGGLSMLALLETEVDSTKAAVGDLITARVDSHVRVKGAVVVPKGAVLRGRIRRLERREDPAEHFLVGLEFSELEFDGKRARFYGSLEKMSALPGTEGLLGRSTRHAGTNYGRFRVESTRQETAFTPSVPGLAWLLVRGRKFRIPAGLQMIWRTQVLPR